MVEAAPHVPEDERIGGRQRIAVEVAGFETKPPGEAARLA
jgi:hypothetical protein